MVALSRCIGPLAFLLAGADGSRVARKATAGAPMTKFIAGVPVLNYDSAYGGAGSLGELEADKEEEWVAVVNKDTGAKAINAMCKSVAKGCKLVGKPSKGGVPFVTMRGTEKALETLIQSSHGAIRFVEPDQQMYAIPEMGVGEDSVGIEAETWGLNKIAKDQATPTGVGTTVYVHDTGVRVTHEQFQGRAITGIDMTSGSVVECNGDQTCAFDNQGHGTHCAGTVAGKDWGVANGATITSVKVLGDDGSGAFSWMYAALDWMIAAPARPAVASMSLGGQVVDPAMKDAVDASVAAGIVVVVASGNSNTDACGFTPAYIPSAITVNSMDSNDVRSYFSNYGTCTDIWAPGSDIKSCHITDDTSSRTISGTSMACPHVSGGAALLFETNPDWTVQQITDALQTTATKNALTDMQPGDQNLLLYVGDGGAPPSPPVPPPVSCPEWCGGSYCWYSSCSPCC